MEQKLQSLPYLCTTCAGNRRKKTKIYLMEQEKKSTGIWWLVFLASTAALLFAIYAHWEWLTLLLPFVATSFVKALRLM